MHHISGNHFATYPHDTNGGTSNVSRQGTGFGRITINGKAGQIFRIPSTGLVTNVCQYQAILAQAFGGGVKIAATLVDPDIALSPDNDATVWGPEDNVSPTNVQKLTPPTASALKVTFIAAGSVVIAFT